MISLHLAAEESVESSGAVGHHSRDLSDCEAEGVTIIHRKSIPPFLHRDCRMKEYNLSGRLFVRSSVKSRPRNELTSAVVVREYVPSLGEALYQVLGENMGRPGQETRGHVLWNRPGLPSG